MKRLILIILVIFSTIAHSFYDCSDCVSFVSMKIPATQAIQQAFFCPDDNLKKLLIGLIHAESRMILAALYRLTDEDIAQALVDAHKRGVKVELIVDGGAITEHYTQLPLLQKNGIRVTLYAKGFYSIMHNKFFLFDRNLYGRSLVWTGSSNPTAGGVMRNQENVIVTDNRAVYVRFFEKYTTLRQTLLVAATKFDGDSIDENCASLLQFLLSWISGYSSLKKNQENFVLRRRDLRC